MPSSRAHRRAPIEAKRVHAWGIISGARGGRGHAMHCLAIGLATIQLPHEPICLTDLWLARIAATRCRPGTASCVEARTRHGHGRRRAQASSGVGAVVHGGPSKKEDEMRFKKKFQSREWTNFALRSMDLGSGPSTWRPPHAQRDGPGAAMGVGASCRGRFEG